MKVRLDSVTHLNHEYTIYLLFFHLNYANVFNLMQKGYIDTLNDVHLEIKSTVVNA